MKIKMENCDIVVLEIYFVCVKRIKLCNCLCSSSSRFSANLIQNIEVFGAKKYFTDHSTANTIQLFVPTKRKFFGSILFQDKSQRRGIPQRLLDKYGHLFICISLKQTLTSGETCLHCQNSNIRTNSLFCRALFWTSFCFLHVN